MKGGCVSIVFRNEKSVMLKADLYWHTKTSSGLGSKMIEGLEYRETFHVSPPESHDD